jgi:hypothetical protein
VIRQAENVKQRKERAGCNSRRTDPSIDFLSHSPLTLIIVLVDASIIVSRAGCSADHLKRKKPYWDVQGTMPRSTNPRKSLSEAEAATINSAIVTAEQLTSAEVKLVLARHCWGDLTVPADIGGVKGALIAFIDAAIAHLLH